MIMSRSMLTFYTNMFFFRQRAFKVFDSKPTNRYRNVFAFTTNETNKIREKMM